MNSKVRWGVLSTASIGTEHVIPAMIKGEYCDVQAIASRSKDAAEKVAERFGIPRAYGSYEELLMDSEIEAVYIPLPNHLHVPWTISALEAGKHVLVEKPLALSSVEARKLLDETLKYPELKVMEAFMYRHHPQWLKTKELVDGGFIGSLKTIQSSFSFFEDDPESIVNKKEYGGGSLMDIGCYSISLSRFLFNAEPKKVYANIEVHPVFKTDTLATAILEFEQGSSAFFSSTLMPDMQQVEIFGSKGRIVFDLPFNPIADEEAKIWLYRGEQKEEITFDACDQYTIQGDLFSLAILKDNPVPTPLQDAVDNMIVIERIFSGPSPTAR
jgi:predicted dehydrogenase